MRKLACRPLSNLPLPGILTMSFDFARAGVLPVDGRQSPTALAIARGTARLSARARLLRGRANCRCPRAGAPIWWRSAATAKSSSSRSNPRSPISAPIRNGWTTGCTATGCSSPPSSTCRATIFPPDAGLIVADAFGASIICEAPEHRPAGGDAQDHDAALCACRGAAAAGACRSARALRRRNVEKLTPRRRVMRAACGCARSNSAACRDRPAL